MLAGLVFFGFVSGRQTTTGVVERRSCPPCPPPRDDDSDPNRYERAVVGRTVEEARKMFPDDSWRVLVPRKPITLELVVGRCSHLHRVNVFLDDQGLIHSLRLG